MEQLEFSQIAEPSNYFTGVEIAGCEEIKINRLPMSDMKCQRCTSN